MRVKLPAIAAFCAAIVVTAAACSSDEPQTELEVAEVEIQVTSSAFQEGEDIPVQYTCDGADVSPPLSWSGMPSDTRSIALISDDPDAPGRTWVHWVVYGLPAGTQGLPEGVPARDTLTQGGRHGVTDFGRREYGGPCPPRGGPHRYFFKVYALGKEVTLAAGATKAELEADMQGHILAQGQLMGRYQRQ